MRPIHFINLIILAFIFGCKNPNNSREINSNVNSKNTPITFSLTNEKELKEFQSLKLDSGYVNLLLPAFNSKEGIKKVKTSWSELHQELGEYLASNNFDWGVSDSSINLFNKIYFSKDGTIDYYAFKIISPSVSDETAEKFEKLLQEFSSEVRLDLDQNKNFAQCGKSRILNK